MESMNNKIRRAINGEEDALQYIYQHYQYIGDKYYEKNKDKLSKEELYLIIKDAIYDFCKIETNIPLILYIYNRINHELIKYKEDIIGVRGNVLLACQGDIMARNFLINHYSTIVIEKAKEYDYMEYDDLVQFGMIKLIEYIDILITEHQNDQFLTNGIGRAIEIYFNKTLRKQVKRWNSPLNYFEDDLENFKVQYEFSEIVDNYTIDEIEREIIKEYFLERNTLHELGRRYNRSHENVRKIIKTSQPQLRKNYLK